MRKALLLLLIGCATSHKAESSFQQEQEVQSDKDVTRKIERGPVKVTRFHGRGSRRRLCRSPHRHRHRASPRGLYHSGADGHPLRRPRTGCIFVGEHVSSWPRVLGLAGHRPRCGGRSLRGGALQALEVRAVIPLKPVRPQEKLPLTYHLTIVRDPGKGPRVFSVIGSVQQGEETLSRKVFLLDRGQAGSAR
jgi:hypothetical protein